MKNTMLPVSNSIPITPENVANIAKDFGEVEVHALKKGHYVIAVETEMFKYGIYFYDFDEKTGTFDALQFDLGFGDFQPSLEMVNLWNKKKRFGKAYLDEDGDLRLEIDVHFGKDGATPAQLRFYMKMLSKMVMAVYVEFGESELRKLLDRDDD